MGQRELDLLREAARDVRVVENLVIDRVGEKAEEAREEEDHRHEEQEQPERDRTADERARRVAVAVPHADADVDERPVLVLVVGLLCLDPALRVPPHAPLASKRET